MKRVIVGVGAVLGAAAIAAVPAVVGLSGNPSFSQQIPVRVPRDASVVGTTTSIVSPRPTVRPHRSAVPDGHRSATTTRTPEPGDDHGGTDTRSASGSDDSAHRSGDDRGGDDDGSGGGRHG